VENNTTKKLSNGTEYEIDGDRITLSKYDKWEFKTDIIHLEKKHLTELLNESGADLSILLKVLTHMVDKAYPLDGGYRVPCREFERMRSKLRILKGESSHAQ